MSTHLLSPLMEFNEENHSSFIGSFSNFKPCEYVWYDVQVTTPDGTRIVNSRIGSVNNTTGLYAVVGPMGYFSCSSSLQGTHTRHLFMALCGMSDPGNHVTGTFYLNGSLLTLDDLLQTTSYVSNCDDICPDLTVRETLENAFKLTQQPWTYALFVSVKNSSTIDTESKIDNCLADLKLVQFQHSQVKMLRKDQAMILRIAIEVLTKSSMIVLEEPFLTFTPSMTMNVR